MIATEETIYEYHGADGELLFQVLRYEPKDFRQRRPDGKGGFIWNLNGVERVPYRLPQLLRRIADGHTAFVVEGEKDADALQMRGLCATTSAQGAGWTWTPQFVEHFRNAKRVVVIPDCDEGSPGKGSRRGREAARQRADMLRELVGEVIELDLAPDRHDGYDVSDWFADGHSIPELLALVDVMPSARIEPPIALPHGLKTPEGYANGRAEQSPARGDPLERSHEKSGSPRALGNSAETPQSNAGLQVIDAVDLESRAIPPPSFIVHNLFPEGGLVLVTGDSGSCKTALMIHSAVALAVNSLVGSRFATRADAGPVFYLNGELDEALLQSLMRAAESGLDISSRDLPRGKIVFEGERGMASLRFKVDQTDGEQRAKFETTVRDLRPSLIVFDTQRALFDLDEKEAVNVRTEFTWLRTLAQRYRCCIVVLHHLRKTSNNGNSVRDRVSGSGNLLAAIDVHLALVSTNGGAMTALHFGKTRYPIGRYRQGAECRVESIFEAPATLGDSGRSTFVIGPPGDADASIETESSAQRDLYAQGIALGTFTKKALGAGETGSGNVRAAFRALAKRGRFVKTNGPKINKSDAWRAVDPSANHGEHLEPGLNSQARLGPLADERRANPDGATNSTGPRALGPVAPARQTGRRTRPSLEEEGLSRSLQGDQPGSGPIPYRGGPVGKPGSQGDENGAFAGDHDDAAGDDFKDWTP